MAARQEEKEHQQQAGTGMSYWRFAAMIATSVVVMYGVMYLNTYSLSHVQWSESRAFMALTMGGVMALVMLGYMLSMYRNRAANLGIVAGSLLLIAVAVSLDRSQTTVQDTSFMSAMIPHHSVAILRAERAEIADVRVCELARQISESQRREIAEMEWLISDIGQNGLAETVGEAEARPVPEFEGEALRDCRPG